MEICSMVVMDQDCRIFTLWFSPSGWPRGGDGQVAEKEIPSRCCIIVGHASRSLISPPSATAGGVWRPVSPCHAGPWFTVPRLPDRGARMLRPRSGPQTPSQAEAKEN